MREQIMSLYVKDVYSTAAHFSGNNSTDESTDVIVTLSNEERYLATFFTFDYIAQSQTIFKKTGEYLNGKCFYYNNMVLIDNLSAGTIRKVVEHLLEEGVLSENFKKIGMGIKDLPN